MPAVIHPGDPFAELRMLVGDVISPEELETRRVRKMLGMDTEQAKYDKSQMRQHLEKFPDTESRLKEVKRIVDESAERLDKKLFGKKDKVFDYTRFATRKYNKALKKADENQKKRLAKIPDEAKYNRAVERQSEAKRNANLEMARKDTRIAKQLLEKHDLLMHGNTSRGAADAGQYEIYSPRENRVYGELSVDRENKIFTAKKGTVHKTFGKLSEALKWLTETGKVVKGPSKSSKTESRPPRLGWGKNVGTSGGGGTNVVDMLFPNKRPPGRRD